MQIDSHYCAAMERLQLVTASDLDEDGIQGDSDSVERGDRVGGVQVVQSGVGATRGPL